MPSAPASGPNGDTITKDYATMIVRPFGKNRSFAKPARQCSQAFGAVIFPRRWPPSTA